MKKFVMVLCLLFAFNLSAQAYEVESVSNEATAKIQKQISKIGFEILNANGIDKKMVFYYDTSKTINASTAYRDRQIVMYRGLYNILSTEDELAAVLSHEISHGVDYYDGAFRGFFTPISHTFSSKKYEYKADKRAVDFMVHAGYHPVAMIVMLNKALSQQRYDWWFTAHPLTSRRMIEVYAYIYKKYPEYLVNNPYKNDVYYQNFLLTSKENRAKFQKKIETKSKGRVKYL